MFHLDAGHAVAGARPWIATPASCRGTSEDTLARAYSRSSPGNLFIEPILGRPQGPAHLRSIEIAGATLGPPERALADAPPAISPGVYNEFLFHLDAGHSKAGSEAHCVCACVMPGGQLQTARKRQLQSVSRQPFYRATAGSPHGPKKQRSIEIAGANSCTLARARSRDAPAISPRICNFIQQQGDRPMAEHLTASRRKFLVGITAIAASIATSIAAPAAFASIAGAPPPAKARKTFDWGAATTRKSWPMLTACYQAGLAMNTRWP